MDTTSIYVNAPEMIAHWGSGFGPKEYGQYPQNKRGYSHKRTNRKNK